jgi:hypothetical protein
VRSRLTTSAVAVRAVGHVAGEIRDLQRRAHHAGGAMAAQVQAQDAEACAEPCRDAVPVVGAAADAVHQDERLAGAFEAPGEGRGVGAVEALRVDVGHGAAEDSGRRCFIATREPKGLLR